jgi:uncharacterized membrane protein
MKSKGKIYQIRYNTVSGNDEKIRWRLIENGNETLVSNIYIDGHTYTTKDWIEEINDFKWHISCIGHCEIKNNCAYITTIKEDFVLLRHILKTISYRIFATLVTFLTALYLGASIEISALLGIGEIVIKPLIYFVHERVWYKYVKIKN